MSFLRRRRENHPDASAESSHTDHLQRPRLTELQIAGGSHYQSVLERVVGGRSEDSAEFQTPALLLPDPDNPYDPNAVAVSIAGSTVGHVPRENAPIMQAALIAYQSRTRRQFSCTAKIVGGWDRGGGDRGSFGVRLYVDLADLGVEASQLHRTSDRTRQSQPSKRRMPEDDFAPAVGLLKGRHYTTYVDEVKTLRRYHADDEAEKLLLDLLDVVEEESRATRLGVAPWYYEELAKLYRKRKDFDSEVGVLERFADQPHAEGASPPELSKRLEKAKQLRDRALDSER